VDESVGSHRFDGDSVDLIEDLLPQGILLHEANPNHDLIVAPLQSGPGHASLQQCFFPHFPLHFYRIGPDIWTHRRRAIIIPVTFPAGKASI
jgi:hypothetical protein